MEIYRLTYRSVSNATMTWTTLSGILEQSLTNNNWDKITGLLMWLEQRFVQVLEGPHEAVTDCYDRICKDGRHQSVELLALHTVPSRLFPDWSMRAFNFLGLSDEEKETLRAKHCPSLPQVDIPKDEDLALALMLDALDLCRRKKQNAHLLKAF